MPKLIRWLNFRRTLSKASRPRPRQGSIYRWLTLGMTLVVAVTVLLGGVPAIGIIWWQLERQVQLSMLNAQSSTQALFTAEQTSLVQLAQLVSERPTLCSLLQRHDTQALSSYLEVLRQNTSADLLAAITADGQLITRGSVEPPRESLLDNSPEPYADFVVLENPPNLAILAASEVASDEECEKGLAGKVIIIKILDHDFMQSLARDTGSEQSLIIGDHRVATSFTSETDWPRNSKVWLQPFPMQDVCCTMSTDSGETYYVGLSPLADKQDRIIAQSEVALPASAIHSSILYTTALFFSMGVLVAMAGAVLAWLITRRITQPLHELSEAADRMGAGDLETPIPIASGWISIDRLAHQLDRSRRNLQQIQQITRQELRRISHMLGAIHEGIISVDETGTVTWANSDACRLLGRDIRSLLRKHHSQVFPPVPGENITLRDILNPYPGQPRPKRLTILNGQGSPIILSVSHSLLESESKELEDSQFEHILVLRDISEEQAINRLRSEFLANVAHEFRTPLSAISACTELLIDEGGAIQANDLANLAHTINLGVIHLQALVNNLLESATLEAGVFRLRFRPLQLEELLRNVGNMMSSLLRRRGQQLGIEVSENVPSKIWGDVDRLNQALINLLENASKFSPPETTITLSVERETNALMLSVSDSGPGLPTDRFGDLFIRFFTGALSQGGQYGIGLGLPIVKAIAEAHGGRVGAENRPGGGARVWFTIPLRYPDERGGLV
jgi:two-component system phosphate regulon sensor histidine kinase PhoR